VKARLFTHVQPHRKAALGLLQRMLTFGRSGPLDALAVVERGEPLLLRDVLAKVDRSAAPYPVLEEVQAQSLLLVPLTVHAQTVGLLVVGATPSGRQLEESDVPLALEVGRRAAVALENARLFELSREERTRAEEANRAKDEFLAIVSHELRQPLNAMLGWLRLYRSNTLGTAQREQALETVERNVLAQAQLVDRLLDVSRMTAGKMRLRLKRAQLEALLYSTLDAVNAAAHTKSIRLHTQVDSGLPAVLVDTERMQQVLWNLLSNAIKFTPRDGQVTVRLARLEQSLELVVRDSGVGISRGFMPHLFEGFRQAEPSATRTHKGVGLGLAIVKLLVEQHGGTVSVESAGENQGASFFVRLPLAPLEESAPEPGSITPVPGGVLLERPLSAEGLTVLVVDDEPQVGGLLVAILSRAGARVVAVRSATEALAQLPCLRPDVLLVDLGLAQTDGQGLLAQVRSLPAEAGGGTPAVALAESARSEERARAFRAGFQHLLLKPVEPGELVAVVASLCGRRALL
jgi:signal transduction histidine kinase/ActR/RegA family two-component response regulator